jgi:hypothetical protein
MHLETGDVFVEMGMRCAAYVCGGLFLVGGGGGRGKMVGVGVSGERVWLVERGWRGEVIEGGGMREGAWEVSGNEFESHLDLVVREVRRSLSMR